MPSPSFPNGNIMQNYSTIYNQDIDINKYSLDTKQFITTKILPVALL